MSGWSRISRLIVPRSVTDETNHHLAEVGARELEGFVLWAGTANGDTFHVRRAIIPAQEGLRSDYGVCVRVDGDELHRINVELYDNKLSLIAQIHSHPTDAYHSTTDDAYPIATTVGCLSLVVPDFASRPFDLRDCAVYRLLPSGEWEELSGAEVESLIVIE